MAWDLLAILWFKLYQKVMMKAALVDDTVVFLSFQSQVSLPAMSLFSPQMQARP